jgi:hypothetical protein
MLSKTAEYALPTMNQRNCRILLLLAGLALSSLWFFRRPMATLAFAADTDQVVVVENEAAFPKSAHEARWRARILHETIHGALQVMHRDFFDADQSHTLPSRSLEDVFHELATSYGVKLRWLAVNADALNADHRAKNEFERAAVLALAAGKEEFEQTTDGAYRFVGSVRLASQCLKCHVPRRTSTQDRVAGLVIAMPLAKP